jgi:hypothetical protein
VCLDNILVASPGIQMLTAVTWPQYENGLVINEDKCLFDSSNIEFLGHRLSTAGISPLPSWVQAIPVFFQQATIRHLRVFLGLFNFLLYICPVGGLSPAAFDTRPEKQPLRWSAEMSAAFETAKWTLSAVAILDHPVACSLVPDTSVTHLEL